MPNSDLNESLKKVQEEIGKTKTDAERQGMLDQLNTQIQQMFDEPEGEHHHTLRERLDEAIVHFKVEHPQLGQAMEIAVNSLSNLGI
ncbi:MAG: DUF4404 family protein [Anaerolineaceae bacterium]|nr:DUF4404 family protein [Anaerolineaceae bacterium]MCB9101307.1 DUF4404 family protein [Anaerolineales bacterium]